MTLVLPILLFLTFAAVIPLMMRKRRNAAGNGTLSARKLKWILGGYGGLLLSAAIVAVILQTGIPAESTDIDVPGRAEILSAAQAGTLSELEEIRLDKKMELPFEGSELLVELREGGGYRNSLLFYKEDQAKDGTIKVEHYRTPSPYKGMDLTEKIPPAGFLLNGNTLTISNLSTLELEFNGIEKEFIIKHFTNGRSSFESELHPEPLLREENIYLIRVPKGMDVTSGANSFIEKIE